VYPRGSRCGPPRPFPVRRYATRDDGRAIVAERVDDADERRRRAVEATAALAAAIAGELSFANDAVEGCSALRNIARGSGVGGVERGAGARARPG
jgi:hypothetical protein